MNEIQYRYLFGIPTQSIVTTNQDSFIVTEGLTESELGKLCIKKFIVEKKDIKQAEVHKIYAHINKFVRSYTIFESCLTKLKDQKITGGELK